MAVAVCFNSAFEFGQISIGQQFGPATQIEGSSGLLGWQFKRECRHGFKIARLPGERQLAGKGAMMLANFSQGRRMLTNPKRLLTLGP